MEKGTTLLVVDDDVNLSSALRIYLERQGYNILCAHDARAGLQFLYERRPDLVILDIMMPNMDGWEACRRIRELTSVPIIMLTARGQEEDKVTGLKLGADDYMVKPFSMRELAERVKAVLRRAAQPNQPDDGEQYSDSDLLIDIASRTVVHRDEPVDLTSTEMRFLAYLVRHANRVVTHEQLLHHVWGKEYVGETEYTKLFVWRLRQKIENDPQVPQRIVTERGVGYRFVTE